MSHSPGKVLRMNVQLDATVVEQIIGYFEYNGTVDVACTQIFATAEERDAAWRQPQPDPCSCDGEAVTLDTEGYVWNARACFAHGCIVSGRSPLCDE